MTDPVLLDTNIVIDYLRGGRSAIAFIVARPSKPVLSVITVAELYHGVRDGKERLQLDHILAGSTIVALDAATAVGGGLSARTFSKSHGVGLADALIAAAAQQLGLTLVTLNRKYFPMLTDILFPYSKP